MIPTILLDPAAGSAIALLFLSSFLSATVLPGSSELALIGLLSLYPEAVTGALISATVGNTLGGMSTYWLGRLLPERAKGGRVDWLRRYGPAALFLSWLPVVGDGLCAAAGWLRISWLACLVWMTAGKFLRYGFIALTLN